MELNTITLVLIGFVTGIINTLAGAGTAITVAALIFAGIPAGIANATIRVALFFQNIVGTISYKQQKVYTWKEGFRFAIPATLGCMIGSLFAVNIDDNLFKRIIGVVLILLFFSMLFKSKTWTEEKVKKLTRKNKIIEFIIFFAIGIYGGFVQVGVGFMIIAGCVLNGGLNLVKANALKLFIVLCYTCISLIVFIYTDMILWRIGLTLAVGNMLGALIASRFTVAWGPKVMRYIVLVVLFSVSMEFLGVINLLLNL
jgi:uncharacterized membrane protein YfcA